MPSPSRYYSSTAAKTTLSSAIDSGSTSLQLAAASGLPSQYPYTLILEKDTANEEIVEVTGLIGSAYQITRNIDNSGAKAHSIGALVEHGVSARDFSDSRTHEVATSAHGVTGDVVGTGGTQTLTGKILTTATLGSDLAAGGYKITGLATPTSTSDAATKGYIDTSVNSAALSASSAATSASSAATSASSALTSQTSAATSASSAAGSATAAATSAASAATSASSAATSASSALTSQTSAATSATSAATSASSAATSASSALTSQTSAATSATSAAASATAAATSATSAANSATTAAASVATIAGYATAAASSETAAASSATAAATSASSASTSASSALTSANSASTSATSAATSASDAATSATSAQTSASSALTSATAASTSASSAATSASSAAASASDAATSASSAATSYDNFDDRYLGAKSSDPSLDNDNNALLTGALYFNTSIPAMKVYTGTAWQIVAPDTSNFVDKALWTGKGAVVGASATSTPVGLAAPSTSGYILSYDSSSTSGLAWIAANPGDVTEVIAGTGLSGGGTSGSVTLSLSTSGVTAGTYAPATITVDTYGRITSASTAVVSADSNPQIFMLMGA